MAGQLATSKIYLKMFDLDGLVYAPASVQTETK